jgi:hypothetical protein
MWDFDPVMHAYATGPDLDRLIARVHGDPARPEDSPPMIVNCLRTAGCPAAERKVLTQPTGGVAPVAAPVGVVSPFVQLRQLGRADTLKRRWTARDDFLGREGRLSQSLIRKARRRTLNSCLVQPACGVDASFLNESLAPVSRAVKHNELYEKLELFSPVSGCALLTFETI